MRQPTLRTALLAGGPAAALVLASALWLQGGRYVATENAYVKADIVQIAAEVAGRVLDVRVKDHGEVQKDAVLLSIDPEPYRLALARAEAELDQARAQVENLRALWAEAQMELQEAQGKVAFFGQQQTRQRQLAQRGVAAAAKLEEADSNATAARDRVGIAQQKLARTLTALGGDAAIEPVRHALVREKQAARDRATLDLERTVVRAPASGIAVAVRLQAGEQVKAATPLFAVIADTRPWVEANFKETDLTHVRPGQTAEVVLDIYPGITWLAEVESISPATGAEFAILPPQNASGNWVKIVQRLPVRLRLLAREGEPQLRAGMTASVAIDTGRERRISSLFAGRSAAGVAPPPAARERR